jgi:hypothetical protein
VVETLGDFVGKSDAISYTRLSGKTRQTGAEIIAKTPSCVEQYG